LVIWPVKIVPEMTYNMLSGTLSFYTTTTTTLMNVLFKKMGNSTCRIMLKVILLYPWIFC